MIKMKLRRIHKRTMYILQDGSKVVHTRKLVPKTECDICRQINRFIKDCEEEPDPRNRASFRAIKGLAEHNLKVHLSTGLHWKYLTIKVFKSDGTLEYEDNYK